MTAHSTENQPQDPPLEELDQTTLEPEELSQVEIPAEHIVPVVREESMTSSSPYASLKAQRLAKVTGRTAATSQLARMTSGRNSFRGGKPWKLASANRPASAETIDEPLVTLREAIDMEPAAKTAYREAIDKRTEELCVLYSNNAPLQHQIKITGDALFWLRAGEPGEPLPEALVAYRDGSDQLTHITLDPAIGERLANKFSDVATYGTKFQIQASKLNQNHREIGPIASGKVTKLLGQALAATPGLTLLRSFLEPVQSSADRRLTPAELIVREQQEFGRIRHTFGLNDSSMSLGSEPAASKALYRATNRLDEETVPSPTSNTPADALARANEFFRSTLIAKHNALRPDAPIPADSTIDVHRDAIYARSHDYSQVPVALGSTLNAYIGEVNGDDFKSPANRLFRDRIINILGESRNSMIFAVPVAYETADNLLDPSLHVYTDMFDINDVAWLRQPHIPEERILDGSPDATMPLYHTEEYPRNSLVDAENFEHLVNTPVGHLLTDKRTDSQRSGITLISISPSSRQVLDSSPLTDPALRLQLSSQVLTGDQEQPYIPGYRLAHTERLGADRVYDFARDDSDPYEPCPATISETQLTDLSNYCKNRGLQAIGTALHEQPPETITDLVRIIQANSDYFIPEDSYRQGSGIDADTGRYYGQCTTFATLSSDMITEFLGLPARTIDGLAIQQGGGEISALGHQQTLVVYEGRAYILDATPGGTADMRSTGTRVRQASRAIGNSLRNLFEAPASEPAKTDSNTDTTGLASEHKDSTPNGRGPNPQEIAAGRTAQAFTTLAGSRQAYQQQLRVRLGLGSEYNDPDRFATYMRQNHGREGDPYTRVLHHTIVAAPVADSFDLSGQFSDDWINDELRDIAASREYLKNLVSNPEAAKSLAGITIHTAQEKREAELMRKALDGTLNTLASNYQAILTNRSKL